MTERKLCPREPTREMISAGYGDAIQAYDAEAVWRAMWDAAPAPATEPSQHKPGCDALGGYGHGIGPCTCAEPPPPAPPDVAGLIARLRTQARAKDAEDAAAALEALARERDALSEWQQEAVRQCAKRGCANRDRNLREAERRAEQAERELVDARELLHEAGTTMRHARVFIDSREKMHRDGIYLYDEIVGKISAAIDAARKGVV